MSYQAHDRFALRFTSSQRHVLCRFAALILAISVGLVAFMAAPAYANSRSAKKDPIAQAKATVAQAKKEAGIAASQYSNAFSALTRINDELTDAQTQLASAEGSISTLQVKASTQAKDAYIRSSDESSPESYADVVDETRREQFLATVAEFDDTQLTNLVSMQEDLKITRDQLAELQKDRKASLDKLSEQKKALDAKLADATKAQATLEAKIARDNKAAAARAASAKRSSSSTAVGTIINPGGGAMACPVQGGVAFTNDWGQPRSGGRTHKGTDIFAARGTPNVAVVSGRVSFANEGTGGISAYLSGSNGITYYYTHLSSTVGGARNVSRGEVIGHTGNTGNASGGANHTHFEIRMGGANGTRVNPYPTLRSIC